MRQAGAWLYRTRLRPTRTERHQIPSPEGFLLMAGPPLRGQSISRDARCQRGEAVAGGSDRVERVVLAPQSPLAAARVPVGEATRSRGRSPAPPSGRVPLLWAQRRPGSPCTLGRFIAKARRRPDARRVTNETDDTTLATASDGPTNRLSQTPDRGGTFARRTWVDDDGERLSGVPRAFGHGFTRGAAWSQWF
jgi:hypothetical protein